MKRAIDLAGAGIGLVVLSPLMAGIAVLVWRDLGSPFLFRQTRPGKDGEPFTLYKFRTMRATQDASAGALSDGERLTDFGEALRSTSLDELPELLNVFKGDMSLVGPRPLLMRYLPLYSDRQRRRHEVRPGITGWAQINGRNAVTWEEKFEMDVWYVENRSLILDLEILARTLWRVITREGINPPGERSVAPFRGTETERGESDL